MSNHSKLKTKHNNHNIAKNQDISFENKEEQNQIFRVNTASNHNDTNKFDSLIQSLP